MAKVGDTIRIINMNGEPQYTGREGVITSIDDMGQIHLDSCGCAIIPDEDNFEVIASGE